MLEAGVYQRNSLPSRPQDSSTLKAKEINQGKSAHHRSSSGSTLSKNEKKYSPSLYSHKRSFSGNTLNASRPSTAAFSHTSPIKSYINNYTNSFHSKTNTLFEDQLTSNGNQEAELDDLSKKLLEFGQTKNLSRPLTAQTSFHRRSFSKNSLESGALSTPLLRKQKIEGSNSETKSHQRLRSDDAESGK